MSMTRAELVAKVEKLMGEKNFTALRELMLGCEGADISEIFEDMPDDTCLKIYRLLPKELAAEVFVEMDSDRQKALIDAFSERELAAVLDEMYVDDTVDMIDEMPANVVKRILAVTPQDKRAQINELLKYPHDSAGSIMTTEYIRLRESSTVADAFDKIRKEGTDKETIYNCYVTDDERHLVGIVSVRDLLLSSRESVIGDIMEKNVISVTTTDDQEQTAMLFDKYGFLALPVVDNENRLVGIITVDDAIGVLQEEAEEDFAKMAAITPSEKPYLRTSALGICKTRIPWLLLLMLSATFTSMIISSFEAALSAQLVLTAFIPMLMDTGGNSGSQASVTVIRGISLGEIEFSDLPRVIWKEFRVAVMCGITLAAATFVKILLVDKLLMGQDISILVDFAVCVTLCLTVICAKIIGCTLPMLAKKIGFDPAVMASPFITTIVDAVSLLMYFFIASLLLGL